MRKFLIAFLFIVGSCADIQETPKPDRFYGDDLMVEMMTDLYLIEASMTANRQTFTDLQMLPHDFIYKKYETDSTTFSQNLNYYTDRNILYKELMEKVQEKITVLKDTVTARQNLKVEKENNKLKSQDSILTPKIIDPDN